MLKDFEIQEITQLRKELHANPELAHNEKETASRIVKFVEKYEPDEIISNIGGNGLAVVFKGKEKGPRVLVRCDLDALPIDETNSFEYQSNVSGVSHKCGHDGHMSMVAGLSLIYSKERPKKGSVVLLFQPAEETGQGAEKVINDSKFEMIKPDYAIGLHNLPGFDFGKIIIRNDTFAASSKGMIIRLKGKTSHAGEPENGISPSNAVAEIIKTYNNLPEQRKNEFDDFLLLTIIHVNIGERAFGTSPGYAEVMSTLRTYSNEDMEMLTKLTKNIAEEIAKENNLKIEIEWVEEFPATVNSNELIETFKASLEKNNIDYIFAEEPFRWSEDFGHFTNNFKGLFFGLGSGEDTPQLHNPDYDFPDKIIKNGVEAFYHLIKEILGKD